MHGPWMVPERIRAGAISRHGTGDLTAGQLAQTMTTDTVPRPSSALPPNCLGVVTLTTHQPAMDALRMSLMKPAVNGVGMNCPLDVAG